MLDTRAAIVIGLLYGDEGKGTIVDYLCKAEHRSLVVRFSGGSNCAHNVTTDDGRHHTFSQFGSGAFQGASTLLSQYVMVDPIALATEAVALSPKLGEHALNRHFIDGRAPVTTIFHGAANRIKEWLRGRDHHGSCGKGIGELAYDLINYPNEVIRMDHLKYDCSDTLRKIQQRKWASIRPHVVEMIEKNGVPSHLKESIDFLTNPDIPKEIAQAYVSISEELNILYPQHVVKLLETNRLVFEGSQGVGLDEWHGFHPYTTWSTTTQANALKVLEESGTKSFETIGVLRTYSTRHGAGPFVTEDSTLRNISPKEHNRVGHYQGDFRVGVFDAVLARYTSECVAAVSPLTSIALTHMDFLEATQRRYCTSYLQGDWPANPLVPKFDKDLLHQNNIGKGMVKSKPFIAAARDDAEFVKHVGVWCKSPVSILSYGNRTKDKTSRHLKHASS